MQLVILTISLSMFFDAPDELNTSLNRFYGWISYYLFLNMLVYVNARVLFPRYFTTGKVTLYVISVILFIIFALVVMVILQELFYDIAVARQHPTGIALFLNITSSLLAMFLFLGGISALLLFKQRMTNIHRISDLRLEAFLSELSFLKSQINPHFLFNMINNANFMIDEDPEKASRILLKLDSMLQYQFNKSTLNSVLLKDDIAFLFDFLELEKVRRDHFEYTIKTEDGIGDTKVPPLLFIPFVENAVKHNLDSSRSYVHITFSKKDQQLLFQCRNSKPLQPIYYKSGGLGLANIKRRLDLLFENNYTLHATETDDAYTVNLKFFL